WVKDVRGVWISLTIADLRLRFKNLGYQSAAGNNPISQVDSIILAIQNHRAVEYVDSLAGYQTGVYGLYAKRILVKDSPILISPKAGGFPIIKSLLMGMFGLLQ